jgi:hypothetical protein
LESEIEFLEASLQIANCCSVENLYKLGGTASPPTRRVEVRLWRTETEGEKLWKLQTTHTFRLRREGVLLSRQSFSTEHQL